MPSQRTGMRQGAAGGSLDSAYSSWSIGRRVFESHQGH